MREVFMYPNSINNDPSYSIEFISAGGMAFEGEHSSPTLKKAFRDLYIAESRFDERVNNAGKTYLPDAVLAQTKIWASELYREALKAINAYTEARKSKEEYAKQKLPTRTEFKPETDPKLVSVQREIALWQIRQFLLSKDGMMRKAILQDAAARADLLTIEAFYGAPHYFNLFDGINQAETDKVIEDFERRKDPEAFALIEAIDAQLRALETYALNVKRKAQGHGGAS